MNGQGERYERSQDNVARLIVYFGPYLLWGTVGALVGAFMLFAIG
jgi:hypothetical protein